MSGEAKRVGDWGEALTAEYLRGRGWHILESGFACPEGEIDLIAQKGDTLAFVEVKTRRADGLTPPEAAVTPQKFRALTRAALRYMAYTGEEREAQFDLIAVEVMPGGETEVRLIPQAMEYNW